MLKLSPKNRISGLMVYCNECKRGSRSWRCAHPDRQVYRLMVYAPGSKVRRVITLDTKNEKEAISIALSMRESVKRPEVMTNKKVAYSLSDYVLKFIDYNQNPPKNQRPNSPATIKDYSRHLQKLLEFLRAKNLEPAVMNTGHINDTFAQLAFESVSKFPSGYTQEKYFKTYFTFCNYLIKQEGALSVNPFAGWRFDKAELANEIINESEFSALLEKIEISPAAAADKNNKIRQYYYPWLNHAFRLALFTGVRRQEVPAIRWTDVIENRITGMLPGGAVLIRDEKVTSIKKLDRIRIKPIEINDDLAELLSEMGYGDHRGADRYLIDGEERYSRVTILDALSRGFAHYITFVPGMTRKLSFECLRKTYITNGYRQLGEGISKLAGHSTAAVTVDHYVNKLAATGATGKYRRIFENMHPGHAPGNK